MKSVAQSAAKFSLVFSLQYTSFILAASYISDNITIESSMAKTLLTLIVFTVLAIGLYAACKYFENRPVDVLTKIRSEVQTEVSASSIRLGCTVVALAGTGLFLELAMIRWHSSIFPMFAFYKNFSLLACFAGLGLGYATARHRQDSLFLSLGLLVLQTGGMLSLRYGTGSKLELLLSSPIAEQTVMGSANLNLFGSFASGTAPVLVIYGLLIMIFSTTVAIFVPIGQLTGRYMDQLSKLPSYGLNLLGSILGVAAFTALSFAWAPPITWFAIPGAVLVLCLPSTGLHRVVGLSTLMALLMLLAWPVNPVVQRIYSPYQLIERSVVPGSGLMMLLAGGTYYQKVYDFSLENRNRNSDALVAVRDYYELPYNVAENFERVAIVGAGTGNDVAAALRAGAKEVDAVEIDPAILALGRHYHPEKPYANGRVNSIVDDARSFFRTTDRRYDVIVYAVLDSHTQLSQATSVRTDSFVYTLEGFRESYARLNEGGTFYVSFALLSPSQGARIFEMMRQASGQEPIAVRVGYDNAETTAFLVRKGGGTNTWKENIEQHGFEDVSVQYATLATDVDLPTDDWPFFYMVKRVYPLSYLPALALVLILTVYVGRHIFFDGEFRIGLMSFFFLGAGFMLIETKAITELGLLFGNTWVVVAIVIMAILTMAFFANLAVDLLQPRQALVFYPLLISAILFAYIFYGTSLFQEYTAQKLLSVVVLTFPVFFSGIVFSTQLRRSKLDVSKVLGYNILGALFGGLVEYNSMYFGFSFLFIFASVMYFMALLCFWRESAFP